MAAILLRIIVVAGGLWLASVIVPGMEVRGVGTLLGAALVLGIINAVVRPVLVFLTLPITVLTLGLFLLVINAATLALVAWIFEGFTLSGFLAALLGAIVVSITGWIGNWFIKARD